MSTSPNAPLVAVIDPHPTYRAKVGDVLSAMYRVNQYPDAERAWHGLRKAPPQVILVDEDISPSGGGRFIALLRQDAQLGRIPVVFTSHRDDHHLEDIVTACGANAFLRKPYARHRMTSLVSKMINQTVEAEWQALPQTSRKALQETATVFDSIAKTIETGETVSFISVKDACAPLVDAIRVEDFRGILNAVRQHDNYSYAHSLRVATLLSLLGHSMGLSRDEQVVLASGGLLHDAGKMEIPLEILNKPGRLTAEEFSVMKGHVTATVRFLEAGIAIPRPVVTVAAQHHEKLDGSGYPQGLQGANLNELARMAAIADVFSALTDRRVYKPAMEAEPALAIMSEQMPGHLDQRLLRAFRELLLDAVTV